jgi:Thermopsin.
LVHPGYAVAPAPMGLGFYGIVNQSGMLVGSNYTSPSYEATVSLSNLSDFNLVDDGPYSVTFQLNAVLHNVTLFGISSYNFWTQNVVFYSARTHELTFLDNIWNFSSPAFYMSPNVFYEHGPNGNLEAPTFYYAIGPTFTVQYPFSLSLYLNSTLLNGRSAIFFNYSLQATEKQYLVLSITQFSIHLRIDQLLCSCTNLPCFR